MTSFSNAEIFKNLKQDLLKQYDKIMILKLFVDTDTDNNTDTNNIDTLKRKYLDESMTHNLKLLNSQDYIDAGFDLYVPPIQNNDNTNSNKNLVFNCEKVNKLDLKVKCSARIYTDKNKEFNTGYYIHPRSSISKTPLRLANSTGIIDAGYRGNLIAMFDVIYIIPEFICQPFDRYVQICAPSLIPIIVEVVDNYMDLGEETERGSGGFGSTGR